MTTVVALPTLPFEAKNPCEDEGGAVCGIVRQLTDDADTASILKTVIGVGSEILLIVVVAIVVRALLNRAINRVIARTIDAPRLPISPRGRRQAKAAAAANVVVETPERRHQRAETIGSVLRNGVSITVFTIAFIEVIGQLGINLGPIVASAGIVGVALGFGAQNLVKDFLSGIFMILEDQYGVGDVIDVGEATGTVEAVGLRTTRLRDVNGTVWYVRNGEVIRVGNKSQGKAAFDEHGIEIPYKQHTIWMRSDTQDATEPSEPVTAARKATSRKPPAKHGAAKRPVAKKAAARKRTPSKRG